MELLRQIMGLPLDDVVRARYNANASGKLISEVKIDGISIRGFSAFSFVRKLSYVKSPQRSGDGTIGNLNSYAVFTTPQLQIDFSLLFIDSYRDIMNLIYARREHLVECYDIVRDTRVQEKMYFEPEELPKIWTIAREVQGQCNSVIELLGVQDYSVVMVGTNNPTQNVNVIYYDKNGNIIGSETGAENTEFLLGSGVSIPDIDGYAFNNAWERFVYTEDESGQLVEKTIQTYINNEAYRLVLKSPEEQDTKTISFKAQYKDTQEFILSLSYGLGEPYYDNKGNQVSAIKFVPIETIGTAISKANITLNTGSILLDLPVSDNPTIVENEITYPTHIRQGWYYTSQIGVNSKQVNINTELSNSSNLIIYQVFEPVKHTISYMDGATKIYEDITDFAYGNSVPIFTPSKIGYNFVGWYRNADFSGNKVSSMSMPPYNLVLYAKWEKTSQ